MIIFILVWLQYWTKYVKNFAVTQACFKRRATAVLSWLDCNSTAARHQHDLVSDVEFNSVEQNACCRVRYGGSTTFETRSSNRRVARQGLPCYTAAARLGFKRRATAVLKSNLIRSIEFGTAVGRRLKRALPTGHLSHYKPSTPASNATLKSDVVYSGAERHSDFNIVFFLGGGGDMTTYIVS